MSYPGGKQVSGVYQKIINLQPPHDTYVEPLLGSGTIMRLKKPAARNIGIDNDENALGSFTAQNGGTDGVTLHHGDAFAFLKRHPFTAKDLIYCDPPYRHETRSKTDMYRDEWPKADHVRFLDIITELPCMVMISGYWTELYAEKLKDWNSISYMTMTRGGYQKEEWLWFNYPFPTALHDYSYLGEDYRERENIKKRNTRMIAKLKALPLLERQAMLSAIDEARPHLIPPDQAGSVGNFPDLTAINGGAVSNSEDPTAINNGAAFRPLPAKKAV